MAAGVKHPKESNNWWPIFLNKGDYLIWMNYLLMSMKSHIWCIPVGLHHSLTRNTSFQMNSIWSIKAHASAVLSRSKTAQRGQF